MVTRKSRIAIYRVFKIKLYTIYRDIYIYITNFISLVVSVAILKYIFVGICVKLTL